jgi:hypothetical protein
MGLVASVGSSAFIVHAEEPARAPLPVVRGTLKAPSPRKITKSPPPLSEPEVRFRMAELRKAVQVASGSQAAPSPPPPSPLVPITFTIGTQGGFAPTDQRAHQPYVAVFPPVGPGASLIIDFYGVWQAGYFVDCTVDGNATSVILQVDGGQQEVRVQNRHALMAWVEPASPTQGGSPFSTPQVTLSFPQGGGVWGCTFHEVLPGS